MLNYREASVHATAYEAETCSCCNRPRLKYHMDYCMEHPEELSRVAGLQKKVDEVKNVMVDNIEQARDAPALIFMLHEEGLCRRGPAFAS